MSTKSENQGKGKGRPKSDAALRLELALTAKGRVGIPYGEEVGISEANARMRGYNALRALGLPGTCRKAGEGDTQHIEVVAKVNQA